MFRFAYSKSAVARSSGLANENRQSRGFLKDVRRERLAEAVENAHSLKATFMHSVLSDGNKSIAI